MERMKNGTASSLLLTICMTGLVSMKLVRANMLKRADFQDYTLNLIGTTSQGIPNNYAYPVNNYSEWYNSQGTYLQVKQYFYGTSSTSTWMGKGADLRSGSPVKLCQDVRLTEGVEYCLSMDLLGDPIISWSIVVAEVGGVEVGRYNVTLGRQIVSPQFVFTSAGGNLAAVCFWQVTTFSGGSFFTQLKTGPVLDNINLDLYSSTSTSTSTTTNTTQNSSSSNSTTSTSTTTNTNNTNNNNNNNNNTNTTTNTIATTIPINNNNNNNTNSSNNTESNSNSNSNSTGDNIYNGTIIKTNANPQNNTTNNNNNTTPYSTSNTVTVIVINFITHQEYTKFMVILLSDFMPSIYNISMSDLSDIRILIQKQLQSKAKLTTTVDGLLRIQLQPQRIYSYYDLGSLDIYFPSTLNNLYEFRIAVNGRQIAYTPISKQEMQMLATVEPIASTMVQAVFKAYKFMNAFSVSYFILNLISFWNLALMYNFLQISTQPSFSSNSLEGAALILYERNTLIGWGSGLVGAQEHANLNSSFLAEFQKVPRYKNQYAWFASMGITSNFLANYLENIVLLGLLILKFHVFNNIIIKRVLRKCLPCQTVSGLKFVHIFVAELSCLAPFFIIPVIAILLNMGEVQFGGKINTILNLLFVVLLVVMPMLSYSLNYSKIVRFAAEMKIKQQRHGADDQWRKLVKLNKVENNDKFSFYLFNLTVSIFVALGNKPAFFLINTPLLLWRALYIFQNRGLFSGYDKFYRYQSCFIWFVYHFTFAYLYISEIKIQSTGEMSLKQMVSFKYCGFIIIGCILIGGALDIFDFLFNFVCFVIGKVKFIRKHCSKNEECKKQSAPVINIGLKNPKSIDLFHREQLVGGQPSSILDEFNINAIWEGKGNLTKISNFQLISKNSQKIEELEVQDRWKKKICFFQIENGILKCNDQKDSSNAFMKLSNIREEETPKSAIPQKTRKIKRTRTRNVELANKMVLTKHRKARWEQRQIEQLSKSTWRTQRISHKQQRRGSKDDSQIANINFVRDIFLKQTPKS